MSGEILKTEKLFKTFSVGDRRVSAVKEVSLFVGENEVVGLVGESGCGKSTLARLITRLDTPDSGEITLCGQDIASCAGRELRRACRNMKMIFQEPRSSFDPRLTLGASIRETLKMTEKMSAAGYRAESERLLRQVGLGKGYDLMKPTDVSGGECQRAAIARAIAGKPKLLICDEATSALDVSIQAQILELLSQIQKDMGMSVLFISHDLALVSSFCERTYVMCGGEIVEQGETAQIINAPENDYTKTLLASVLPVK